MTDLQTLHQPVKLCTLRTTDGARTMHNGLITWSQLRQVSMYQAQNPGGRFCRRGKYEAVCLPPAASLLDGPVSRNLQVFLCDKIAPGF